MENTTWEQWKANSEMKEAIAKVIQAFANQALNAEHQKNRGLITRDEARERTVGALSGVQLTIKAIYGEHAEASLFSISRATNNLIMGDPEQVKNARAYLTAVVNMGA